MFLVKIFKIITHFLDLSPDSKRKKRKRRPSFRFTEIKRNTCRICHKTLRSPKGLEVHMMTHTGERPFACDICAKSFRQLPHLTAHRLIHFDIKPFQCKICKKRFRQNAHLKVHLILHQSGKSFQCDICLKPYRSASNVRQHKLSVHLQQPENV